jgi:4-amino-4-deoxy-L-arabinose transferase-like glycosyltransferase
LLWRARFLNHPHRNRKDALHAPENIQTNNRQFAQNVRGDTLALLAIAAVTVLVHVLTNNRYGFHRDELQVLSDARHMDWGFVPYPPVTPFLERIGLGIFGVSVVGLRIFSVLAQAVSLFVAGLMARELGGGRLAQVTAALTIALSPLPMFEATEFQYSSFDYLWWVLAAYFTIRLLKTENPRWWLAIGAAVGGGLMTKYTMCFLIAGIAGGLVLTAARRYLLNRWFWAGAALALLIFLPNLLWQIRHDFISWHFLQHIHKRDVGEGRSQGFLRDQFIICVNLIAAPLWITGLICYLRDRRYRMLAWMYLIPLALFIIGKGRGYYLAAAYPMLVAMGCVAAERWVGSLRRPWRLTVEAALFVSLIAVGVLISAMLVPFSSGGRLKDFALRKNGDLREEIGWSELVKTVSDIRDALPPEQKQSVGVLVGNYGEQGALEILGPAYNLPLPISMTNSAWLRGYPIPPPSRLIVLGFTAEQADNAFTSCRLAGHNTIPGAVKNEEGEDHPDIFVCGPPRMTWPEFWKEYQGFG